MSEINLGIIGAGGIAKEHLKVIHSLRTVNLIGITSRTLSKAEELAKTFHIQNIYNSVDDLTNKCALDGVLVLVSADQIYNVAKKLLPLGVPTFLEKPPGILLNETQSLAELADKHGTKNMVGYNRRYYSIFHKGQKIIENEGNLLGLEVEGHERFWRIADRSITQKVIENWIYVNSTHTIDLLRFFGGEVENINTLTKRIKEKKGDQFVASMEFKSGSLGTYRSHWYSPGGWSVTLFGDGVTVKYNPLEKGVYIDTNLKEHQILPDQVDIKFKPGFYRQMENFISLIRTGSLNHPGVDLSDSIMTMRLAEMFVHA